MRARFIVFEGVEGSGKTTQARLLAAALERAGEDVVLTREPGGTVAGERLREVLLGTQLDLTPLTEMLIFCAARAQHVSEVIRPALHAGKVVISDRFELSTIVYQGYAGGIGMEVACRVNEIATGGLHPDVTIILDLDPKRGLERNRRDADPDRMEKKTARFHALVREGYLLWAREHPDNCLLLDATQPVDVIHQQVLHYLQIEDKCQ